MGKRFEVGTTIVGTISGNMGVVRQITEVRDTGYTWIYPDIPDKDFWSENSCDPFFELFWAILDDESRPNLQHFIDRNRSQDKDFEGVEDVFKMQEIAYLNRMKNHTYCNDWHTKQMEAENE